MKILIAGDSWNFGYGVDEKDRWSSLLSPAHEVTNISSPGAGNDYIRDTIMRNYNYPDLLIVGWSGTGRKYKNPIIPKGDELFEMVDCDNPSAEIAQLRLDYFQSHTVDDLLRDFSKTVQEVEDLPCKVLHYTVFGEKITNQVKYKLDTSMLEYLASFCNKKFLFDMPIFEFDYLHETSFELVRQFMELSEVHDWEYGCFERELLRLEKNPYFLDCGHPSECGHQIWSKRIEQEISRI